MAFVCGMKGKRRWLDLNFKSLKTFFNIPNVLLKKKIETLAVLCGENCISCFDSPFSSAAMYLYGSWP